MHNDVSSLRGVIRAAREKAVADDAALVAAAANAPATAKVDPPAVQPAAVVTDPPATEAKAAPTFHVYKADAESGVIYTFASSAGTVDADEETIERNDLISMAHGFTASKARAFNANHGQDHYDLSKAELVESIVGAPILKSGRVLKLGEELPKPEDDALVGMNVEKGAETHWLIGFRPNDDAVIEAAKKGAMLGASFEGFCTKVEVK